jgi:hypothetical protein
VVNLLAPQEGLCCMELVSKKVSKYVSLTNRIYNCHLHFLFRFYNKHSTFFATVCGTDGCEGLLGVAPRNGTVSLSLSDVSNAPYTWPLLTCNLSLSLSPVNNAASRHSQVITTLTCLTPTSSHGSNTLTVQGQLTAPYLNR